MFVSKSKLYLSIMCCLYVQVACADQPLQIDDTSIVSTPLRGLVTVESTIEDAQGQVEKSVAKHFVRLSTRDECCNDGLANVLYEISVYPEKFEFYSRNKLAEEAPLSKRSVRQDVWAVGKDRGIVLNTASVMWPLVPSYNISHIISGRATKGLQVVFPLSAPNPFKPTSKDINTVLTLDIMDVSGGQVTLRARNEGPPQTWEEEGQTVTYRSECVETATVELDSDIVMVRSGQQEIEVKASSGYSRKEIVTYNLWRE